MVGFVAAQFAALSSSFITPTELRDFQFSVCWDGSWGVVGGRILRHPTVVSDRPISSRRHASGRCRHNLELPNVCVLLQNS